LIGCSTDIPWEKWIVPRPCHKLVEYWGVMQKIGLFCWSWVTKSNIIWWRAMCACGWLPSTVAYRRSLSWWNERISFVLGSDQTMMLARSFLQVLLFGFQRFVCLWSYCRFVHIIQGINSFGLDISFNDWEP